MGIAVTASVAELLVTTESEHEIVELPAVTPVATPLEAIVATPVLDEAHVTEVVISAVAVLL